MDRDSGHSSHRYGNPVLALGLHYLLRQLACERHPLRNLAITLSSVVLAPGAILALGAVGWPNSAWNVLIGLGVFVWINTIPGRLEQRDEARWLANNVAEERAYRAVYASKLEAVCSQGELRRLQGLWDVPELSYEQRDFWSSLVERWYQANPCRYASQDQARAAGLLCACEPSTGHSCRRRSETTRLPDAEAALSRLTKPRPSLVVLTAGLAVVLLNAMFPRQESSSRPGPTRWLLVYLVAAGAGVGLLLALAYSVG